MPAVRFTDEAEKVAAGTVMIHDALRAAMTSIIRHAQEGVAADKRDAFLDCALSCHTPRAGGSVQAARAAI